MTGSAADGPEPVSVLPTPAAVDLFHEHVSRLDDSNLLLMRAAYVEDVGAFCVNADALKAAWPSVVEIDEDLVIITNERQSHALVVLRSEDWTPETRGVDTTALWWL